MKFLFKTPFVLLLAIACLAMPFSFQTAAVALAEDKAAQSYYKLNSDKYIARKSQGAYNLCWAFSASRSLETYLQNFNITIDISESYASLAYANYVRDNEIDISQESSNNPNYIVGSAGHSLYFQRGLNTYGIATEQDVPYSLVSTFRSGGIEAYKSALETYSNKANTTLVDDLSFVWAGDLDSEKEVVSIIKTYLTLYGSVYTQVNMFYMHDNQDTKCIYTPETSAPRTNHAVSIVGWDDNYTYGDHKGAFIIMNSYGANDEFLYVMYDDYNASEFAKCIQSVRINGVLHTTNTNKTPKDFNENVILLSAAGVFALLITIPPVILNHKLRENA